MRTWTIATLAGIAIGVTYALSPATVWFGIAMWVMLKLVSQSESSKRSAVIVEKVRVSLVTVPLG